MAKKAQFQFDSEYQRIIAQQTAEKFYGYQMPIASIERQMDNPYSPIRGAIITMARILNAQLIAEQFQNAQENTRLNLDEVREYRDNRVEAAPTKPQPLPIENVADDAEEKYQTLLDEYARLRAIHDELTEKLAEATEKYVTESKEINTKFADDSAQLVQEELGLDEEHKQQYFEEVQSGLESGDISLPEQTIEEMPQIREQVEHTAAENFTQAVMMAAGIRAAANQGINAQACHNFMDKCVANPLIREVLEEHSRDMSDLDARYQAETKPLLRELKVNAEAMRNIKDQMNTLDYDSGLIKEQYPEQHKSPTATGDTIPRPGPGEVQAKSETEKLQDEDLEGQRQMQNSPGRP